MTVYQTDASITIGSTTLRIYSGTVTHDTFAAVQVRAEVEVARTTVTDALEPRTLPTVRVWWSAPTVPDDGRTRQSEFYGVLTGKSLNRDTGRYRLVIDSRDALLDAYAPAVDDTVPLQPSRKDDLNSIASYVLNTCGVGSNVRTTPLPTPSDIDENALIWRGGETGLTYLQRLLQAAEHRIMYIFYSRYWTVQASSYFNPTPVPLPIPFGEGNGLISATFDTEWSSDWCDAATIVYHWPGLGNGRRVDSYKAVSTPTRTRTISVDGYWPGAGRARNVVLQAALRYKVARLVVTARPAISAGIRISFTALGRTWTGSILTVTHDLADGTMRLVVGDLA